MGQPDGLDELVDALVEEVEVGRVGTTQAARALDDRGQHRVGVTGRPADRRQHLAGGIELVLERGVATSKSFVFLGADCPRGHDRIDHAASQPSSLLPLSSTRNDAGGSSEWPDQAVRRGAVGRPSGRSAKAWAESTC